MDTKELFEALSNGDISTVQKALAEGIDPNLRNPATSRTLFQQAILSNQYDIATFLGKEGSDPNRKNSKGQTLLEELVCSGEENEARIRFLLENKYTFKVLLDIENTDPKGNSTFGRAIEAHANPKHIRLLLKHANHSVLLLDKVWSSFLSGKWDPSLNSDIGDAKRWTDFTVNRLVNEIKPLIDSYTIHSLRQKLDQSKNLYDFRDFVAALTRSLSYAIEKFRTSRNSKEKDELLEKIEFLLQQGADPNHYSYSHDNVNDSAIHIAISTSNPKLVELLLNAEINTEELFKINERIRERTGQSKSYFDFAKDRGFITTEIEQLFIKKGLLRKEKEEIKQTKEKEFLPPEKEEQKYIKEKESLPKEKKEGEESRIKEASRSVTRAYHLLGMDIPITILDDNMKPINVKGEGNFHIPSLSILREILTNFKKGLPHNSEVQKEADELAEAFQFTLDTLTKESDITNQTKKLMKRYNDNNFVITPSGWIGHAIGLMLIRQNNKTYLVYSNRGEGMRKNDTGTMIYEVSDHHLKNINEEFIASITTNELLGRSSMDTMIRNIFRFVDRDNPFAKLETKEQKHGTCSFVNPKALVMAHLYLSHFQKLLTALKTPSDPSSHALLEEAERNFGIKITTEAHVKLVSQKYASKWYKEFTNQLRDEEVKRLVDECSPKNPKIQYDTSMQLLSNYLLQHHGQERASKKDRTPKIIKELKRARMIIESLNMPEDSKREFLRQLENRGCHLLRNAAKFEQKELVELLLSSGCNINLEDNDGMTPLEHAINKDHKTIINLLLEKSNEETFLKAVKNKKPQVMSALLTRKNIIEWLNAVGNFEKVIKLAVSNDDEKGLKIILEQVKSQKLRDELILVAFNTSILAEPSNLRDELWSSDIVQRSIQDKGIVKQLYRRANNGGDPSIMTDLNALSNDPVNQIIKKELCLILFRRLMKKTESNTELKDYEFVLLDFVLKEEVVRNTLNNYTYNVYSRHTGAFHTMGVLQKAFFDLPDDRFLNIFLKNGLDLFKDNLISIDSSGEILKGKGDFKDFGESLRHEKKFNILLEAMVARRDNNPVQFQKAIDQCCALLDKYFDTLRRLRKIIEVSEKTEAFEKKATSLLIWVAGVEPYVVSESFPTKEEGMKECLDLVNIFINKKINLNETDKGGNTAFMLAIKTNKLQVAELLLTAGCDPFIPNDRGETPLELAKSLGLEKTPLYVSLESMVKKQQTKVPEQTKPPVLTQFQMQQHEAKREKEEEESKPKINKPIF